MASPAVNQGAHTHAGCYCPVLQSPVHLDVSAARVQVAAGLAREYPSLLHFVKEELARQEYVMNVANEELQAALNVVLEENMYLGQVLFYCLDRLFLQVPPRPPPCTSGCPCGPFHLLSLIHI